MLGIGGGGETDIFRFFEADAFLGPSIEWTIPKNLPGNRSIGTGKNHCDWESDATSTLW